MVCLSSLLLCVEGKMWNTYGVSDSVGMAMQTKICFSKVNFSFSSEVCPGDENLTLLWATFDVNELERSGLSSSRGWGAGWWGWTFFPLQTVICGERGATVWSLCLLLLCPVAVRLLVTGSHFTLAKPVHLYKPQNLELLIGKMCNPVTDLVAVG